MATAPRVDELAARVRKMALALPGVVEEAVDVRTRTGRRGGAPVANYAVSNQRFARVLLVTDPADRELMWLWVRTDALDRRVLLSNGHPFFSAGGRAVGVFLEAATDWDEIEELITESYLKVAPKKLAAEVEASISTRDRPSD